MGAKSSRRIRRVGKQYYGIPVCALCDLPIPDHIVNPHHFLAGSIDHITPKSKGGKDSHDNRQPAHRGCNILRSSRDITEELKAECRERSLSLFRQTRMPDTKRWRNALKGISV